MSDDRPPAEGLENTLWLADLLTPRPPTSEEIAWDVRLVFDELDMRQLAIFRRLSAARRTGLVFEICRLARSTVAASISSRNPDVSKEELNRQVAQRIMMTHA